MSSFIIILIFNLFRQKKLQSGEGVIVNVIRETTLYKHIFWICVDLNTF